ncbi:hypothetical protein F0562_022997 [Nyssa sinensis]|uniref:non-specific serine/threonine protein kinase n=1 Tax=Nyssa sinensis TaxID=561372 RepID=A0A5J5BF92_9ASTE|nr:hypothetical protein F0562_022997 [Nyssa sinensis]
MLDNYKDNSDNFMNEVTTIGTIHHVNVIRLLGFCWDGSKQALIYEYMPWWISRGLYIPKTEVSLSLGLTRLVEIALGVAHGIEYLHNGCESRILHLDIKPQNVLLDQDFNPKISDFGLAKVYSRNKSAVTMTEMSSSSEAYFPGWIYDKLIEEKDMELADSVVEEEVCIERKMVMVGLWCIQINPRDRPSMTRVVEMLSGNVEAIEMPPRPFFFSPPRVQFEHETTSFESDTSALPLTFNSQEM